MIAETTRPTRIQVQGFGAQLRRGRAARADGEGHSLGVPQRRPAALV